MSRFCLFKLEIESSCLNLGNLRRTPGSKKRFQRVGRGISAGQGESCGRGMRGQKSRSGAGIRPTFEGGQTPLFRRMPKYPRRTQNYHRQEKFHLVQLQDLSTVKLSHVNSRALFDLGFLGKYREKPLIYKIVGNSPSNFPNMTIEAHAFTKPAREIIETNGGKCVLLSKTRHVPILGIQSKNASNESTARQP